MAMSNYYNVFDERAAYDDKNTISDNCNTFKVLIKLIIDWDGIGLDISKYPNNTNVNSALPSLEKERQHYKGM